MSDIFNKYKEKADEELAINAAIEQLHSEGLTITESVKVVMQVYGMPLEEAKEVVSSHQDWVSVVDTARPLHEDIVENLK